MQPKIRWYFSTNSNGPKVRSFWLWARASQPEAFFSVHEYLSRRTWMLFEAHIASVICGAFLFTPLTSWRARLEGSIRNAQARRFHLVLFSCSFAQTLTECDGHTIGWCFCQFFPMLLLWTTLLTLYCVYTEDRSMFAGIPLFNLCKSSSIESKHPLPLCPSK